MTKDMKNTDTFDKSSNEDLIEGIFPTQPTKVRIPSKEFKPWHKPRKHFIRINQWQTEIDSLIRKINFDGRPLRYISLPGDDFLDVRTLQGICKSNSLRLRFLGFNDMEYTDVENSLVDPTINEIMSFDWIDEKSLLTPDRFENLYQSESMASKYVDDTGSFDILNLDLCNSFSTPSQRKASASYPTTYDALLSLIQRQTEHRAEPWLFFLTTRCAPNNVHHDDISKFWDCIENNLSSYKEFAEKFKQLVNGKSREQLISSGNNDEQRLGFTKSYCVGLGKWLLQTVQSGSPKWTVRMLKSYYYRVSNPYDMLSAAFLFERITKFPYDSSGLSEVSRPFTKEFGSEEVCAIEMIKTTLELKDVDLILQDNQNLRDEMILGQGDLLHKAGYSQDLYIEWLEEQELL